MKRFELIHFRSMFLENSPITSTTSDTLEITRLSGEIVRFKKVNSFSLIRSASGMTLVEILMVVGLTGVVMSSIISMLQISAKQQLQATLTFQAQQIEKNLVKLLNDPNAWRATYTANAPNGATAMACLANAQPCTTNGQEPNAGTPVSDKPIYKIMDSSGALVYDLTNATTGFAPTGKTCTTWVAPPTLASNNLCPLRFEVTWDAKCTASSCVNPGAMIHVKAFYNPDPKLRVVFNATNYSTDFYQGSDGSLACQWGWSVTNSQLTEVCAPFVGIGVDATTHFATRMEVYGTEKVYGQAGAVDTNGDNAVYLNGHGIDGGRSGLAIGYGNKLNGANMSGTGYISAEQQGVAYRNLVLNPLATGSGTGFVGINTSTPSAPLDVTVNGDHKILTRGSIRSGDGAGISSVNGNNSVWKPLDLEGYNVSMYANGGGTNLSQGNFQVNGSTLLNGPATVNGSEVVAGNLQVNSSVQVYGSETVNGDHTTGGNAQVNGNLGVSNNVYIGALGNWMTYFLNQPVRSDNAPTFAGLTINNGATTLNRSLLNVNYSDLTVTGGSFYINNNGSTRFSIEPNGTFKSDLANSAPVVGYFSWGRGAGGGFADINYDGGSDSSFYFAHQGGGGGTTSFMYGPASRTLMTLFNSGFVSIPSGSVSIAGDLTIGGCYRAGGSQIGGNCVSDRRLKSDIQSFSIGLDELVKLQPRIYKLNGLAGTEKGVEEVGFVAQELESVIPSFVKTKAVKLKESDESKTEIKTVNYSRFIFVVINAVKELFKKLVGLDQRVAKLEAENKAMKQFICKDHADEAFCRPSSAE